MLKARFLEEKNYEDLVYLTETCDAINAMKFGFAKANVRR
jgi:hypothetical protein